MKIKIRYENEYQTLEVETEELQSWLNITILEEESQEDFEKRIQQVFEEEINRSDYNSWHKHDRHTGFVKTKRKNGDEEVDTDEALMEKAMDKSAFFKSITDVETKFEYEEMCKKIRELLKPEYAEMVIAIVLDEIPLNEYANSIGDTPNNVSHRYRRAINKLKKVFQKTSF